MIIMVDARVKVRVGERPVFLLASLSITVLLGTKIGRPPTPSKFQVPQHRCLYQFSELEFRFSKAKHCWGGRMVLSLRLVQLLLLLRSLYCDDLEIETTRLRVFLRRVLVGPLVADVDIARCLAGTVLLLQRLAHPLTPVLRIGFLVPLVPCNLLDDGNNFLVHRHNHDEGCCTEGPHPADRCPDVEAVVVEDVGGEHGARPDADEEEGEEDGGSVRSDLGRPELPDDNLQRRAVVEILAVVQVQLSLVLGHPGREGVVDVPCLLPLKFLHLRSEGPPRGKGNNDAGKAANSDGKDVAGEHGQLFAGVLDKCCRAQPSLVGGSIVEPAAHAHRGPSDHPADYPGRGSTRPQDRHGNGHHGGGDEDAGEVVGPSEVQVDGPAEEAEGDGEEGAENDAPVLVVEQSLLVLLVVSMSGTGVVGLYKTLRSCSQFVVSLALDTLICARTCAKLSIFVSLLNPEIAGAQDALAVL